MSSTNNTLLGASLAAFVLGSVSFVIYPAWAQGRATELRIQSLTEELAKPVDGPEIIQALTDELETVRKQQGDRVRPIPEESDASGLIRGLSEHLDSLGIVDRTITTGQAKTLSHASLMPMTVMMRGDYSQVSQAIRYIETIDRLVRLQRVRIAAGSLSRSPDASRSGIVQAELLIDVFYAPRGGERKESR